MHFGALLMDELVFVVTLNATERRFTATASEIELVVEAPSLTELEEKVLLVTRSHFRYRSDMPKEIVVWAANCEYERLPL